MKLTFALKQQNTDILEQLLLDVSDPDSPHYGEYRTVEDITNIVAPSEKTVETVRIWLLNSGKYCFTIKSDFVRTSKFWPMDLDILHNCIQVLSPLISISMF